jgi:hypothetical protein
MRIQETLLESQIRQSLRRMTHYIENEADEAFFVREETR